MHIGIQPGRKANNSQWENVKQNKKAFIFLWKTTEEDKGPWSQSGKVLVP